MRLISIKIENFKTHKSTAIDFTTLGSPILIKGLNKDSDGSNGAGKSSIFDAIEYVLYGRDCRYLRNGESNGSVVLEFEKDGVLYDIKKSMTKDGYTIELKKDGQPFSASKLEIEKYIRDTLRISKSLFDQTIFQSQGFSVAFGLLSPKMKSEFVMELLEMDKWQKYSATAVVLNKNLSEFTSKLNVKRQMLEGQVKSLQDDITTKDESALRTDLGQKQQAIRVKQETLKSLQGAKAVLDKKETLRIQVEDLRRTLKNIKAAIDQHIADIAGQETYKANLQSRRVAAVDETYRSNLLASALAMEKNIAALQHELTIKQSELDEFMKINSILLQANSCPFCRRTMDESCRAQLSAYVTSERDAKQAYITTLNTRIASQNTQRSTYAQQVENLGQQCEIYNRQIKDISDIEQRITILKSELTGLQSRANDNQVVLTPLQMEYDAIKNITTENVQSHVDILEADVKTIWDKITELSSALSSIIEDKAKILSLGTEVHNLMGEINQYNGALGVLAHVRHIFSQNGIQKWLFTNVLAEISSLANSLLAPIGFAVVFQMEKAKKNSDGFKPVFDIAVIKTKENWICPVEQLSGGEKTMIHFAIRLAFSTIMAMKYNFRFMVIDEGFSDLDDKNRELVGSMINQLSSQFQIFLVTHIPDFENMFHNVVYVERANNVSQVIIQNTGVGEVV